MTQLGEDPKAARPVAAADRRLSSRAVLTICGVKLVLAPLVSISATAWAAGAGVLGDVSALGPLFLFLLLVEPAMPSAQSLVLLLQA